MAVQNTSKDTLQHNVSSWGQQHLKKGHKIIYEGEAAYVIAVKPVLIVKTKDRVVCGTIHKHFRV